MKRATVIALYALVMLAMSLGATAQDPQRKVTPVRPKTNKVLTPPKGTDEKIIQQYLTGDTAAARAKERKDSLARIYPHYPAATELTFGVNIGDLVLTAFGQKYQSVDLHATLNMWNRLQPTLAVGMGRAKETPDDMNYTYRQPLAPYFRLGVNYNFLFKSEPRYQLYGGARLGYTAFKYDITDAHLGGGYWGEDVEYNLKGVKSHALWIEAVAGLKVGLFKNWALGWEVRYHSLLNYGKSDNGKPWYIPGYGVRTGKWAFGLSLFYTIPLNTHRWPVKEDKAAK